MLFLKEELDNERRKSLADEEKIRKLEGVIQTNSKKMEQKIQELQDALDAERRKSMMDEERARQLERQLNEKVYVFNELNRRKS